MATATVTEATAKRERARRKKTNNSVDHGVAHYYNLQLRSVY
jgi:hypothetical protein